LLECSKIQELRFIFEDFPAVFEQEKAFHDAKQRLLDKMLCRTVKEKIDHLRNDYCYVVEPIDKWPSFFARSPQEVAEDEGREYVEVAENQDTE
jgi:hypothetical protein